LFRCCEDGTNLRPKHNTQSNASAERVVTDIQRATRSNFSSDDNIWNFLEALRCQDGITELSRKEAIAKTLYYTWSKKFMEAGKLRVRGRYRLRCMRLEGIRRGSDTGEPSDQKHDRVIFAAVSGIGADYEQEMTSSDYICAEHGFRITLSSAHIRSSRGNASPENADVLPFVDASELA
jgi:hypothetical protein